MDTSQPSHVSIPIKNPGKLQVADPRGGMVDLAVAYEEYLTDQEDIRDYVPAEWDRRSIHYLIGPYSSIKTYCQLYGLPTREDKHDGFIHYIENLRDLDAHLKGEAKGYFAMRQAHRITLHLLYDWERITCVNEHGGAGLRAAIMMEALQGLAIYSHLMDGSEVDVETGSPAILDGVDKAYNRNRDIDPYLTGYAW